MRDAAVHQLTAGREWRCHACGLQLASFDTQGLDLHPLLRRKDGLIDGMVHFGRGNDDAPVPAPTRRFPLVIDCPAGGCGAANRVA